MDERPDFKGGGVDFLNEQIKPYFRAFEWGSGGSTLWLGARCQSVVSIEHDMMWYIKVQGWLDEYSLTNVELIHIPKEWGSYEYANYANKILEYPVNYFHLVCVDGRNRVNCVRNALPRLMPGGLLVLDDYLRSEYWPAIEAVAGWESHLYYDENRLPDYSTGIWRRPRGKDGLFI